MVRTTSTTVSLTFVSKRFGLDGPRLNFRTCIMMETQHVQIPKKTIKGRQCSKLKRKKMYLVVEVLNIFGEQRQAFLNIVVFVNKKKVKKYNYLINHISQSLI